MSGFEIPQSLLLGGELFLIGFFMFIIFYIIIRLFAERHEHSRHEINKGDKDIDEQRDKP